MFSVTPAPSDEPMLQILERYSASFAGKIFDKVNNDSDLLMDVFDVTDTMKNELKQYWGRELGMCWQRLVTSTLEVHAPGRLTPVRTYGRDAPYDVGLDNLAIDTKYRVGSGDSGTLKKFKTYGPLLRQDGMEPVMLFLRDDNLPAAISALKAGTWEILTGQDSFDWIASVTDGFRLDDWMRSQKSKFALSSGRPSISA